MYLYRSDIYYLLTIVMFVVSLICSGVLRSRFNQYAKCRPRNGMTGAMAAERILRASGIMDVSIAPTAGASQPSRWRRTNAATRSSTRRPTRC